jgi:hypothetical protein
MTWKHVRVIGTMQVLMWPEPDDALTQTGKQIELKPPAEWTEALELTEVE